MRYLAAMALLLLLASPLHAQLPATVTGYQPIFLGYGSEPEMDFGGRTVMSLQSVLSRAIGGIGGIGESRPGIAPAWEFPVAAALLLVQHEVGGHGARAREFGLSPSYAFNYAFSAATGTERPPATNEENTLLATGGAEADGVMARRVLLDLLRPEGADGARVPLAFMAKLDLTVYALGTEGPDEQDFADQYRDGNDVAYYLVSRQADRRGADPAAVWLGTYDVLPDDPLLESTWDDVRVTALWNLLDPSLAGALMNYFRQHVIGGETRVRAPMWRVSEGVGLSLGTHGALGPGEVSRFLDLHAATRRGVLTVYVRDLDSSVDRAYGFGAGVHGFRLTRNLELGLGADTWDQPDSRERVNQGSGWNAAAEIDAQLGERWGLSAKVGAKSEGFFPGLPLEDGPYFGFGVLAVW